MRNSNEFSLTNFEINSLYKRKKFKIYCNALGTMNDVISLLSALENNYNLIFAYEKIRIESILNYAENINNIDKYCKDVHLKFRYLQEENFSKLILSNEYLVINRINFNSPGFWEVIGSCSPLRQIRKYVSERHERQRDKVYAWELDKKYKEAEIDEKELNNDLLRLTITKEMISQLESIDIPNKDINEIVWKSYQNLSLLNRHIDEDRITYIEEMDLNEEINELEKYK